MVSSNSRSARTASVLITSRRPPIISVWPSTASLISNFLVRLSSAVTVLINGRYMVTSTAVSDHRDDKSGG